MPVGLLATSSAFILLGVQFVFDATTHAASTLTQVLPSSWYGLAGTALTVTGTVVTALIARNAAVETRRNRRAIRQGNQNTSISLAEAKRDLAAARTEIEVLRQRNQDVDDISDPGHDW